MLWYDVCCMASITIDTYRFIKRLSEAGMPESQAKALADEFQHLDLEHVATKQDIAALELTIQRTEARFLKWIIPMMLGQVAIFTAVMGWLLSLFQ